MKRNTILAVMLCSILFISSPALAFGLTGEMVRVHKFEVPFDNIELKNVYGGQFRLFKVGPFSVVSDAQFAGNDDGISLVWDLIRKNIEDIEDPAELEGQRYVIADLGGKVRVDWPIPFRGSVIGGVGYKYTGFVHQNNDNFSFGLFQGLTYEAGLGVEIARGLRAYGLYEFAPKLTSTYKENLDAENAQLSSFEVGIEYKIPFLVAKAGYRTENLKAEEAYSHRFSGVFIGAGLHF